MKGADYRIEENTLFGKYRIISTLGTGSSSTVYLAKHLKLKIYRAIKCIPKDTVLLSSLSLENSFPMEAVLLKTLNHPGIPLIYDIDEDDDFIYIIEEYIPGESLDIFLSDHQNISQELIIQLGIQLCDILDYLHHLSPYPILYQDLKPEHIILCGNQLKLVDFGFASFFTESGNQYQFYGTEGFAAPEALNGLPVSPSCDIYSLGQVLKYMTETADFICSSQLLRIIEKATAIPVRERFQTAESFRQALTGIQDTAFRHSSHLIRNIAVTASRPGAGATHFAVSLVSSLNKKGYPAVYMDTDSSDSLSATMLGNHSLKEHAGIYSYRYFKGIPLYGDGIEDPASKDCIRVKDYGSISTDAISKKDNTDLIIAILSGSDWDMAQTLAYGSSLKSFHHVIFVCSFGNRKASKKLARLLGHNVCCFPCDTNPYRITAEKERLISSIWKKKGGQNKFSTLIKKGQNRT